MCHGVFVKQESYSLTLIEINFAVHMDVKVFVCGHVLHHHTCTAVITAKSCPTNQKYLMHHDLNDFFFFEYKVELLNIYNI